MGTNQELVLRCSGAAGWLSRKSVVSKFYLGGLMSIVLGDNTLLGWQH